MAKFDISALKSRLEPKKANNRTNYSNERYLFWEMGDEEEATIRFLPDKDESNPWFLHEYKFHDIMVDGKKRSINCLKNYGEHEYCPLCDQSQEFYNNGNPAKGKQWYRKMHWLAQVMVIKDPLPADPETGKNAKNEYRTVALSRQVYDALINSIKDDMDETDPLPSDYNEGRNFVIRKQVTKVTNPNTGKMEDQANYGRSKFERKATSLSEDLMEVVDEKLVLLSSLMPQRPDLSYVETMKNKALGRNSMVDDMDDDIPAFESPKVSIKPKAALFEDPDDEDIEEFKPSKKVSSDDYEIPKSKPASRTIDLDDDDDDTLDLLSRVNAKRKPILDVED